MSKVNQLKNKARREEQRENWSRAIELYTQALDASRKNGEAFADLSLYNRIGDIYLRIGQKNTAVRYYEQAIERYADQDLHSSAIALCNKVLRIHPQRSTIFLQLGRLNLATNLIADARAHFHKYAEAMRERGADEAAFEALEEMIEETGDPRTLELWISWLAAMSDQDAAIARVEEQRNSLIAHGIGSDQVIEQVRTGETGHIERDPVAAKPRDPLADAFLSLPEPDPAAAELASAEEDADGTGSRGASGADEGESSTTERDAAVPGSTPHPALGADLAYPVGATDLPGPEEPPEPLPLLEGSAEESDVTEPIAADEDLEPVAAETEADAPGITEPEVAEPTTSPSAAEQALVPDPAPLELGSIQWDDEAEELLAELNRPLEAAWSEYANETHDPSPPVRSSLEPETEPEREEFPVAARSAPAEPDAPEVGVDESHPPAEESVPAEPDAPETGGPDVLGVADDWTPATEALDLDSDASDDAPVIDPGQQELETDEPDAGSPVEGSEESATPLSEDLEDLDGLASAAFDAPPGFEATEPDSGPDARIDELMADLPSFAEEPPVLEEEVPEPEAAEPAEEDSPDELEPVFEAGTIQEPEESGDFTIAEPESEPASEPELAETSDSELEIEVEPTAAPDPIGEVELAELDDGLEDSTEVDLSLIEALEVETPVEASGSPAAGADEDDRPVDEMTGSFAESRLTIEEDPEDAFRDWVQSASMGVLKRALPELENRSETEKALLVIERLSQLEDTDVEFRIRLIDNLEKLGRVEPAADACLTLGTALHLMGRMAEARKVYERALRIRPGHEAARAALEQLGDSAEEEGMEEAIPVVPTPYTAEFATANDSQAILETPIRSPIMPPNGDGPQDVRPYSGVAGGAEASADFEQLLTEFRAELHQKPGTTGSSHTELGASLKEMGRLDDAIRELQAAVREPSAPPLAYELLGEAFLEKGQGRIAIRLLEKALGALGHGDRELMGVLYQLGRAYESMSEQPQALVCYERIFSVDIDYRDIQERILTCST